MPPLRENGAAGQAIFVSQLVVVLPVAPDAELVDDRHHARRVRAAVEEHVPKGDRPEGDGDRAQRQGAVVLYLCRLPAARHDTRRAGEAAHVRFVQNTRAQEGLGRGMETLLTFLWGCDVSKLGYMGV